MTPIRKTATIAVVISILGEASLNTGVSCDKHVGSYCVQCCDACEILHETFRRHLYPTNLSIKLDINPWEFAQFDQQYSLNGLLNYSSTQPINYTSEVAGHVVSAVDYRAAGGLDVRGQDDLGNMPPRDKGLDPIHRTGNRRGGQQYARRCQDEETRDTLVKGWLQAIFNFRALLNSGRIVGDWKILSCRFMPPANENRCRASQGIIA